MQTFTIKELKNLKFKEVKKKIEKENEELKKKEFFLIIGQDLLQEENYIQLIQKNNNDQRKTIDIKFFQLEKLLRQFHQIKKEKKDLESNLMSELKKIERSNQNSQQVLLINSQKIENRSFTIQSEQQSYSTKVPSDISDQQTLNQCYNLQHMTVSEIEVDEYERSNVNQTFTQTQVFHCYKCNAIMKNQYYISSCQHIFDMSCIIELIEIQANQQKTKFLCLCNQQITIPQLIYNNIGSQELYDKIFKSQLQKIKNSYKQHLLVCETMNCSFFIWNDHPIISFCPNCLMKLNFSQIQL